MLPRDLRPPSDQHDHRDDRGGARRLIEEDPDLSVVVFDSANPDFYVAHYDVEHDPGRTAALPVGPTGLRAWLRDHDLAVGGQRHLVYVSDRERALGRRLVEAVPDA